MTRTVGYRWHLRQLMAARGMFATTDLGPLLAERGVVLSASRSTGSWSAPPSGSTCTRSPPCATSWRCTPADLVEVTVEARRAPKAASSVASPTAVAGPRPAAAAGSHRARREQLSELELPRFDGHLNIAS